MMKRIALMSTTLVLVSLLGSMSPMADPTSAEETSDPVQITAGYRFFSSTSLGDAVPGEKKDAVGIYISGEPAWKIYYAMNVPVKKTGLCDLMYKQAGDLICYLSDTAHCEIGIILKTGKTTGASIC